MVLPTYTYLSKNSNSCHQISRESPRLTHLFVHQNLHKEFQLKLLQLLDTRTPDESIRNGASESDATTSLLFPQNSSIQILNGPSSTTGSGATAAAFILPAEPLASTATPTATAAAFIHHFDSTRATLYGSLSNGTSGGNFILVSPFIDVTRA